MKRARPGTASSQLFTKLQGSPFPSKDSRILGCQLGGGDVILELLDNLLPGANPAPLSLTP